MTELKINPTFRDLIPPLSAYELEALEAELRHWARAYAPIITWNGTIVDGHHRYEICKKYNLLFKVEETQFEDEDSAMLWIIDNQSARRNLTTASKIRLAMKKLDILKGRAKKRMLAGKKLDPSVDLREGSGKVSEEIAKEAGVSPSSVERFMYIEKHADKKLVDDLCEGEFITDDKGKTRRLSIDGVYNETKLKEERAKVVEKLESLDVKEVKATEGVYDVISIDPPWGVDDVWARSAHAGYKPLQYPTMSVEEIKEMKVPCTEDCHVFLWTTQKFLPKAFEVIDAWGLDYVCTFIWAKNGGPKALGLPVYNAEFFIYARKGRPQFVDTKNFFTVLNAKRGGHSEKPEEFYDMLRRVTAGRRLDMFNRREIEGFEGWGNECA